MCLYACLWWRDVRLVHAPQPRPRAHGVQEGRPSIDSVELGRVVERALKDSRAIDTEALCIMAGEKVRPVRRCCDVC